jgi:hypothetical protein
MWRAGAVLLLFANLFLVDCSGSNREGKPLTLQPGRVVRVLEVVPPHYPDGDTASPPTLLFEYQTDLTIPTKATESWHDLYAEIAEIWSVVRKDAEKDHYTSAIIRVRERPHGLFVKKANMWSVAYQIGPDHEWHILRTL